MNLLVRVRGQLSEKMNALIGNPCWRTWSSKLCDELAVECFMKEPFISGRFGNGSSVGGMNPCFVAKALSSFRSTDISESFMKCQEFQLDECIPSLNTKDDARASAFVQT